MAKAVSDAEIKSIKPAAASAGEASMSSAAFGERRLMIWHRIVRHVEEVRENGIAQMTWRHCAEAGDLYCEADAVCRGLKIKP